MARSWHDRQHGWTCMRCGAFNDEDDSSCGCEREAAKRDQLRWERTRDRWDAHDKTLVRSLGGVLYRVRRFTCNRLRFTVLVLGGYSYQVEWHRVPSSVRMMAVEHFFGK